MSRYTVDGDEVTDTGVSPQLVWTKVPTGLKLWSEAEAAIPSGFRIPTLAEFQSLVAGQKAVPADFAAAFGEGNAPVAWFWVKKTFLGRLLGRVLEKPGHVAAKFVWEGRILPFNRRIVQARARFVKTA
jgi:hypothetical protein